MGRIADLFGKVAAAAEDGPEGLILHAEAWDRLREDWEDEDIEDAMRLVRESLLRGELVEAADSLSARLLEVLEAFGDAAAFRQAENGGGRITLETISNLARRVARLEEVLDGYREGAPPDHRGFEALRRRLADQGIEAEMSGDAPEPLMPEEEE